MKPSQFVYSEYIKEQKVQMVNTNLMRKTDQEKYTSMSSQPQSPRQYLPNTSPIYSLVNLPLKEGQFGEIILPKSLTSYDQQADPIKIVKKNTEIARSLKKLKPIEQEINSEEMNFTSEAKNQKQKGPKHLVYLRTLNQLTGGLFKKTSSSLLFGSLEPKINQNTTLCVARIQELKFFNQYNQRNDKIPALFSWEALYKKKSLIKTSPKDFVEAQKDLLDFLHPRNSLEPAEIILWKIKNNDEKYIGQFEITTDDYKYSKEVLDYKSKFISETYVEKEMFRIMKNTKTFIGNVKFQLIQLADDKIILNKHTQIPGSPRTDQERARHKIIDSAMSGQEYRWHLDEKEKLVIQQIDKITQQIVAETTIEVVQDECGNLLLVFESKYSDPETNGRSRPTSRQMRRQQQEANMNLIKELDSTGIFTEVQGTLRKLSRQGKLTKKALEDALQAVGCSANKLFLTPCSEFGDCFLDYVINTDDIPAVLEVIQEVKLVNEDELQLESVATNFFKSIGRNFRNNEKLKSVVDFIKALEKKPEVALLIFNYSYSSENILSAKPPFLNNFNPKNYEHVMVLGKLNKLIMKFGVETKFTKALKKAQVDAKKEIYFEIPCFPKNKNLSDKVDSLQLKQMGQNIFHEVVRRRKWSKSHQMFEQYPEWFFVADEQGYTPFSLILEQAPFDVIKQLFLVYHQQLKQIFEKFNPNENLYEQRVPNSQQEKNNSLNPDGNTQQINKNKDEMKSEEDKLYEKRKENQIKRNAFNHVKEQKQYRKNIIHNLLLNESILTNSDSSLNDLKDLLRNIEELVGLSSPDNFEIMKSQKLRAGDFIPLCLFLEIIRSKLKRKLDRVQREFSLVILICQMLTPIQQEKQQTEKPNDQLDEKFQWTSENQLILSKILAHYPEHLFEILDNERFAQNIDWVPPFPQGWDFRYIHLPFRALIKQKQLNKLLRLVQYINEDLKRSNSKYKDYQEASDPLYYSYQVQQMMYLEIINLKSDKLHQVGNQLLQNLKQIVVQNTDYMIDTNLRFQISIPYQKSLKCKQLTNELLKCQTQISADDLDMNRYKVSDNHFSQDRGYFFNKLHHLNGGTEKQEYLIQQQKEQILRNISSSDCPEVTTLCIHSLILRSFQTKRNIGVSQQQVAEWIRGNYKTIQKKWIFLYLDFFRNSMSMQQIHTLIDLDLPQHKRTYYNQNILSNYLKAQGRNWAALLNEKLFAAAIKDNQKLINIEETIKSISINGQYSKLKLLLPLVTDNEIIRKTIHFVSTIAGLQIFYQKIYLNLSDPRKLEKEQQRVKQQEQANEKKVEDEAAKQNDEQLQKQENEQMQVQKQFLQYYIRCFDPQKSTYNKNINSKKEKKQTINSFQFPDALNQIRTPLSLQSQLIEMSPHVEIEINDMLRTSIPKPARISISNYEKSLEKDVHTFRYLQTWKQSLKATNSSSIFAKGSDWNNEQSYKKVLQLLIEKFGKFNLPLCQSFMEFQSTLLVQLIYGFVNMEQILEQFNKSKLTNSEKTKILLFFLKSLIGQDQNIYISRLAKWCLYNFQSEAYYLAFNKDIIQKRTKFLFEQIVSFKYPNSKKAEEYIPQIESQDFKKLLENTHFMSIITEVIGDCSQNSPYSKLTEHYLIKNRTQILQSINLIIKFINLNENDEETKDSINCFIIRKIKQILIKSYISIQRDYQTIQYQIAIEILLKMKFYNLLQYFEKEIQDIAKIIVQRKVKDKSLIQLAEIYCKDKINQSIKLSHYDIIKNYQNKSLEEALQVDFVSYFVKYNDKQCVEIISELFKLPYKISFKEELIKRFDSKLFESLMFNKKYLTYHKLIDQILLKQILNGNQEDLALILSNVNQQYIIIQDSNLQVKVIKKKQKKKRRHMIVEETVTKPFTLAQAAFLLEFYEYFDTLHRLKISITIYNDDDYDEILFAFMGNRFGILKYNNDELLNLSLQFEGQGQNFICDFLKILRSLRMKQKNYLNKILLEKYLIIQCAGNLDNRLYMFCSMLIVNEFLKFENKKSPHWQNSQYSLHQTKQMRQYYNLRQQCQLSIMWMNGVEKGVKFCLPTNYNDEITLDEIRKTTIKKPVFTIQQYIEYKKQSQRSLVDISENQMPREADQLKQLQKMFFNYKQPEFLIDKKSIQSLFEDFDPQDDKTFFYLVNFPTFWFDSQIPKEKLLNANFYNSFELGIVLLRATILFEPKQIEKIFEIYFLSIVKEQENKKLNNKPQVDVKPQEQEDDDEYEMVEVEVQINDEEEQDQNEQNDVIEKNIVNDQEDQEQQNDDENNSENQKQNNQEQLLKKPQMEKRKKKNFKPEEWKEPQDSLNNFLKNNLPSKVYLQIFLQLLLFASTNEQAYSLVEQYFTEYSFISPKKIQVNIDPLVKERLKNCGFSEPFDEEFIKQKQKIKVREFTDEQLKDIKYVEDVLTQNAEIESTHKSQVFQVLFYNILNHRSYFGYLDYIKQLTDCPAFNLLINYKRQIFSKPLEKDLAFQQEFDRFSQKMENGQLESSFIQFFLDNYKQISSSQISNDKWIKILYLLTYYQETKLQITFFSNEIEDLKSSLTSNRTQFCEHYKIENDYFSWDKNTGEWIKLYQYHCPSYQEFNFDLYYQFSFLKSGQFKPLTYQYNPKGQLFHDNMEVYEQASEEFQSILYIPDDRKHIFQFNLALTTIQTDQQDHPFPKFKISQKYSEEIFKTLDKFYYKNYILFLDQRQKYEFSRFPEQIVNVFSKNYVPQISGDDDIINYIQIKNMVNETNFRDFIELHLINNFFIDVTVQELQTFQNLTKKQDRQDDYTLKYQQKARYYGDNPSYLLITNQILLQLIYAIQDAEKNNFTQSAVLNGQEYNLFSEIVHPEIRFKYLNKYYGTHCFLLLVVPYSNYISRIKSSQFQGSLQVDLSFPELFPIVNLQAYKYVPVFFTQEQFYQKYNLEKIIQAACHDIYLYSKELNDFIRDLPSDEDPLLQYVLEKNKKPLIIQWPIIKVTGKNEKMKFKYCKEAHPLVMIEYFFQKLQFPSPGLLKFTFNVQSMLETIVLRLSQIIQKMVGESKSLSSSFEDKLNRILSMIEEWPLFKKSLLLIENLLIQNELNKFKFYYVEFQEVAPNPQMQIKVSKLEGLDNVFRFGCTQFYVHSNVLIIRLTFAVFEENANNLLIKKNPKLRALESSQSLFKEDSEIQNYQSQIVSEQDLIKQILQKRQ